MQNLPPEGITSIRNSIATLQASSQARQSFAQTGQSSTPDAPFRRATAPHLQSNLAASNSLQIPVADRTIRPGLPDAATARGRDHFLEEFKAQIEEHHIISKTINSATQSISVDQKLQADGKNFAAWVKLIRTVASNHLGVDDFFFKENLNPYSERVGRAIILASIHASLVPDLQDVSLSHEMYNTIKKKFKTVSFAGQLNIWGQFLNFKIDRFPSSSGIASHLRNMLADWRSINVKMNSDSFLAFVLAWAIRRNDVIYGTVHRCLEDLVQKQGLPPTFDQIVHILDISRQQLLLASNTPDESPSLTSTVPPSINEVSVQNAIKPSPPVNRDNEPHEFDVYAASINHCWQRNSKGHFLRDCPHRARPENFNRKVRGPVSMPFNATQNQIYPIVGAVYPPVPVNQPRYNGMSGRQVPSTGPPPFPRPHFNPTSQFNRSTRTADSYVPHPRRSDQRNNPPSQLRQSQVGARANQIDLGKVDYDFSNLNFQSIDIHDDELLEGTVPQFQELGISTSELPMEE